MPPKVTRTRTHQPIKDRLKSTIFQNITVSFWESGQREPDLDSLVMIARYFDVSADYLLGLSDY